MAILKRFELARQYCSTTGTGPLVLGAAVPGYLTYAQAGAVVGDAVTYSIRDGASSEVGWGPYSAGPSIARNVLKSTNNNLPLDLSGNAEVFCGVHASDFGVAANQALLLDDTGKIPAVDASQIQKRGWPMPQGRLHCSNSDGGVPSYAANYNANGTIYYRPYRGIMVPVFDGTIMRLVPIVSGPTDNAGIYSLVMGGSAAWGGGSNYDLFLAIVSGTVYFGSGSAWTASTAYTGPAPARAATLQNFNGLSVNYASMTLRTAAGTTVTVPAQQATYLGSFFASAPGSYNIICAPGPGGPGHCGLWNMYNRHPVRLSTSEPTSSWTYATGAWRVLNANQNNICYYLIGDVNAAVRAELVIQTANGAGTALHSIGANTTSAYSGPVAALASSTPTSQYAGLFWNMHSSIGLNYQAPLEFAQGGTNGSYGGLAETFQLMYDM
jgi:hypothetical protein